MASDLLLKKKVEIYLATPLFPFRYKEGRASKKLMDNVVHLSATIIEERSGGLIVDVSAISDQKITDQQPPLNRIFLPYRKIDLIICT